MQRSEADVVRSIGPLLDDPKDTDLVIPILSVTGAGKSRFINVLADQCVTEVGHDINPKTLQIQYVILHHPADCLRRIIILDTPGFDTKDDGGVSDLLILEDIKTWLSRSYPNRMGIAGLLYLQEISQLSNTKKYLELLDSIRDNLDAPKAVLATTKWTDVPTSEVGKRYEEQLEKHTPGSEIRSFRFDDSHKSGWDIIKYLIDPSTQPVDYMIPKHIDLSTKVSTKEIGGVKRRRRNWKKEITGSDMSLADERAGDLLIPIMGPTGAGKSTFINTLLGCNLASVGHELQSVTQQICHYRVPGRRRVFVVDTPGFDDTNVSDREILRRISVWLAHTYSADMKVAGFVYLQEITRVRATGATRKNLDMFEKLSGPTAAANIVLATTKWGDVREGVAIQREQQLRDEYWNDMLHLGSKMHRFIQTQSSAQAIVNEILAQKAPDAVQVQSELVRANKFLAETHAGRTLRYTLKELLELQKMATAQLREHGGDAIQTELIENATKMRSLRAQISELKIPLSRKVSRMLGMLKE